MAEMPFQMSGRTSTVHPLFFLTIAALYALHQDFWFWRTARPLVFGFLPIGLAYHAAYCLAAALLMWALTRFAWPAHLERDPGAGGCGERPTQLSELRRGRAVASAKAEAKRVEPRERGWGPARLKN
jgi:Protein of unknown function (DUF3311)